MKPIHIGIMVPANNTTYEREVLGWLPPGSRLTVIKIPRGPGLLTPETLPAYRAQALELALAFKHSEVDVVAYGCTAAGFIFGPEGDASLAGELRSVTGKPVVTTAGSMVRALTEIQARQICLVSPYLEPVNQQLRNFLSSADIRVHSFGGFFAKDVHALGQITEPQVAQKVRASVADGAQAVFIACAQLPTQNILKDLAEELGVPVLSSNWGTTHFASQTVA